MQKLVLRKAARELPRPAAPFAMRTSPNDDARSQIATNGPGEVQDSAGHMVVAGAARTMVARRALRVRPISVPRTVAVGAAKSRSAKRARSTQRLSAAHMAVASDAPIPIAPRALWRRQAYASGTVVVGAARSRAVERARRVRRCSASRTEAVGNAWSICAQRARAAAQDTAGSPSGPYRPYKQRCTSHTTCHIVRCRASTAGTVAGCTANPRSASTRDAWWPSTVTRSTAERTSRAAPACP